RRSADCYHLAGNLRASVDTRPVILRCVSDQEERPFWADDQMDRQRQVNAEVVAELRERKRALDRALKAGADMLILHTVGAKTGLERISPLGCTTIDEELVIIASFQGGPRHPG